MKIYRLIVVVFILFSVNNAQQDVYKQNEKFIERQNITDSVIIKSIINEIVIAARHGRTDRINRFLSDELKTSKITDSLRQQISPVFLKIEDITISISGDNASSEINLFNAPKKEYFKETMTFVRNTGKWKLKRSSSLINLIMQPSSALGQIKIDSVNPDLQTTKKEINSNLLATPAINNITTYNEFNVTEFFLSSSALIRKHMLYTQQNYNISTINQPLVSQHTDGSNIFSSMNDAKFTYLSGGDILGVVADKDWNRLIYGSFDNHVIKSYGDNSGDQWMDWVSRVGVDKFGNVLVLTGFPQRVDHLKYDESLGNMTFLNTIPLSGVQEVSDICMDDNFTPENQSDDTFWLTDIMGNAIFNLTFDGNFPTGKSGIYTSVTNAAGNNLVFNKPTSLVVNYGTVHSQSPLYNLALIDSDKKRIIIIDVITGYEGNTIRGEYTVVNFTGQTNVALNSIGYSYNGWQLVAQSGNGLWVADPNNGMFHVFCGDDTRSGYLGSVKSLGNGISQWNTPKSLASTAMSNSRVDVWEFFTLDKYDENYGINTYYAGADMVNIVVKEDPPLIGIGITASFINFCSIPSIKIYGADGSIFIGDIPGYFDIYSQTTRQRVATIIPSFVSNPVGKYIARFTIEPYDNMWYEPFYRQTIIKDVPFAMPLAGTLTGPLWGMSGTDYTWQTNITSGSGDFTYTWYKQSAGSNVWDPITSSNGSTCSLLMGSTNFTLKCDVTDTFNGQTKSFSKYITSGTLLSSEQWFGNNNITGPVTVPAGITLTIVNHPGDPATKLTFTNGASLNVNGSFVVNGESTKKITFDFVAPNSTLQNGIRVNQGGGVVLSHSIIKNGYIGININQALGSIANSEITGCSFGFVISGTNYIVTQPEITNCKIHANPSAGSGWGFLVSGSSPLLIGNEIYDNFTGVFLSGLSQPSFGNQWNYGNNNIHNNTGYGIYESYYSPPFLGRDGCEVNGGRNILENNGIRDLYVTSYVPVIAENNWWGSNSPSTTKIYSAYNTIDYYPWLGFRPTQQYANMKLFPEENLFNSKFDNGLLKSIDNNLRETAEIPDENVSLKEKNLNNKYVNTEINSLNIKPITAILDSNLSLIYKLGYAKRQIDLKHYQTAQLIAKEIIEKYPDSSASFFALGLLWQASKVNDLESYKTFLKDLGIKKSKKELYGVAEIIESGFNKSDRFVKLNQIMNKYKKTKTAEYAYLDLFMYYAFELNDKIKAKETGDLITSSFPNTPAAMMINQLAEINNRLMAKKATTSEASNSDNELPTEYELLGNYPNPFNPSTTISYALPLQSSVEINIFDIMGRLVRTFELNGQSAGYQNVLWNGRNENNEQVASGIYLYRFKAIATDGKVFEKTAKLLMLK